MSIIGTIVIGFIVGLLARALKPGDDKLGIIMTTLLGIGGAFVARYAGAAMGLYQPSEPAGWIASDRLHPGDAQYAAWADVIWDRIRQGSMPRDFNSRESVRVRVLRASCAAVFTGSTDSLYSAPSQFWRSVRVAVVPVIP